MDKARKRNQYESGGQKEKKKKRAGEVKMEKEWRRGWKKRKSGNGRPEILNMESEEIEQVDREREIIREKVRMIDSWKLLFEDIHGKRKFFTQYSRFFN